VEHRSYTNQHKDIEMQQAKLGATHPTCAATSVCADQSKATHQARLWRRNSRLGWYAETLPPRSVVYCGGGSAWTAEVLGAAA
jgi:hypothetical protein